MNSVNNPFALFSQRRFLPFFLTQFSGAFNDNLFKNGLVILVAYQANLAAGQDVNFVVNLAAGLFILPFFLFSAFAGHIADYYEKASLIRRIKFAEILIMLLAALGFYLESLPLLLAVLFFMGTQSTFFGPIKYAIIPQHLPANQVMAANAQVEMGTFVAILTGTLLGGLLAQMDQAYSWISVAVLLLAALGFVVCQWIPLAPGHQTLLITNTEHQSLESWEKNPLRQLRVVIRVARLSRRVWYAMLANSWFWFLGAAYLTQFPNFAKTVLMGSEAVVTLLLVVFSLGIGLGSWLCAFISRGQVRSKLVPLSLLGMTLCGFDLYFSTNLPAADSVRGLVEFLSTPGSWRVLLDLLLMSMLAGLYVVPLYAIMQLETPSELRARTIAAANIFNALFMLLSALLGIVMLSLLQWSIPDFFALLSSLTLLFGLGLIWRERSFSPFS